MSYEIRGLPTSPVPSGTVLGVTLVELLSPTRCRLIVPPSAVPPVDSRATVTGVAVSGGSWAWVTVPLQPSSDPVDRPYGRWTTSGSTGSATVTFTLSTGDTVVGTISLGASPTTKLAAQATSGTITFPAGVWYTPTAVISVPANATLNVDMTGCTIVQGGGGVAALFMVHSGSTLNITGGLIVDATLVECRYTTVGGTVATITETNMVGISNGSWEYQASTPAYGPVNVTRTRVYLDAFGAAQLFCPQYDEIDCATWGYQGTPTSGDPGGFHSLDDHTNWLVDQSATHYNAVRSVGGLFGQPNVSGAFVQGDWHVSEAYVRSVSIVGCEGGWNTDSAIADCKQGGTITGNIIHSIGQRAISAHSNHANNSGAGVLNSSGNIIFVSGAYPGAPLVKVYVYWATGPLAAVGDMVRGGDIVYADDSSVAYFAYAGVTSTADIYHPAGAYPQWGDITLTGFSKISPKLRLVPDLAYPAYVPAISNVAALAVSASTNVLRATGTDTAAGVPVTASETIVYTVPALTSFLLRGVRFSLPAAGAPVAVSWGVLGAGQTLGTGSRWLIDGTPVDPGGTYSEDPWQVLDAGESLIVKGSAVGASAFFSGVERTL